MDLSERNGWARAPLSTLGILISGQSPASRFVNQDGRGTPYVSGPEQWNGTQVVIDKWTTSQVKIVPERSIFIVMKGSRVGSVFPGTAAAIGRDLAAYVPFKPLGSRFMTIALREACKTLAADARGPIPGFSRPMLLNLWIDLPPLAEQARIVELCQSAEPHVLAQALHGELRTGDPTDESADTLLSRLQDDIEVVRVNASAEATPEERTRPTSVDRLIEVARVSAKGITPERLFEAAGYTDEDVSSFYSHLKLAIESGAITYHASAGSVMAHAD